MKCVLIRVLIDGRTNRQTDRQIGQRERERERESWEVRCVFHISTFGLIVKHVLIRLV